MCSYKEINEWFKWKNTPVKDRKLQSVEEKFNDYTKICGGDNETDVLYNMVLCQDLVQVKMRNFFPF